ncbi:universal stress protein [Haloferax sp. MBLA0076]|uniref:Universal stress protein n=1 Tax=Haloferax litoreum TaxID=2666140 RepID=A0A6A8GKV9_9EURY|nr:MULTISPECIES: universal stress protein [Haloferax]KAB1189917.1 universal stress protein [Haloferax sp. CBA1148]MRX23686.1 universal stress protein [Haloferax litoreum]
MRNTAQIRVLVPVAILKGQVIPDQVVRLLSRSAVVLLGYHEIPEQTAPEQAREQFEAKAREELQELVDAFESRGTTVETRLVFTHDESQTIERIATEAGCDAVLLSNPAPTIDRIIVPIKEKINLESIAQVVAGVSREQEVEITLFHAVDDESDVPDGELLLSEVSDELTVLGIRSDQLSRVVAVAENPLQALIEASHDHDVVVMGEEEPTIRGRLFGETSDRVAEQTVGPVLVVRRPLDPAEDGDETDE